MFRMELLMVTPLQNLFFSQSSPSQQMARSQTLDSSWIRLLLSCSISNPLANPMGPAFQIFPEPNYFSTPLLLHSSPSHLLLLLDSHVCLLIGVSSSTLIPYGRCNWCSQSGPLKPLLSIVGQPFPQLL